MELFPYFQGVLIALLGWAATGLWTLGAPRLSEAERRVMIIFLWLIWMFPGFGTLVQHGLLTMTNLLMICGISTVLLTLILLGDRQHWRTKL